MKKMKYWISILIGFLFLNCSSTKNINTSNEILNLEKNCPDDGDCSIVIHKNKKLNVLTDITGSKYYQLLDNETTSVILFEYIKKVDESLQDANYKEEIIFEIPKKSNILNLQNEELQSTKMLFGRHCFCRGQTGYFSVSKGTLKINPSNKDLNINLNFNITEVPQTITTINKIVKK